VFAARIRFDLPQPSRAVARAVAQARPRRLIFNNDGGGDTRVPTDPLPRHAR
jgi:hypothetical protein